VRPEEEPYLQKECVEKGESRGRFRPRKKEGKGGGTDGKSAQQTKEGGERIKGLGSGGFSGECRKRGILREFLHRKGQKKGPS